MLVCSCGTFAIGLCTECRQAVCDDHSALWGNRRLCSQHYSAAAALEAKRREEAHARSIQETLKHRIQAWTSWLEAAERAVAESHNQIERIVRVVAALGTAEGPPSKTEDRPDELLPLMLLPEMRDRRLRGAWWDHDAIQEWFLKAVKVPPEPLTAVHFRKTLFGGTKRITTDGQGWRFPGGSTSTSGERGTPTYFVLEVSVLTDGRRLLGANADSNPGFNANALRRMATMTELAPLPKVPNISYFHPETGVPVWPVQAKR